MVQGKQILYGTNVEFRQSSKPTTRANGSSLVSGDRWLDTTDRIWFYWNGTYWLSEQLHWFDAPYSGTLSASNFPGGFRPDSNYNLYLLDFSFSARFTAGTYDTSNWWRVRVVRDTEGTSVSGTQVAAFNTLQSTIAADEIHAYVSAVNTHLDVSSLSINRIRLDAIKNASAPNISAVGSRITFRLAKP